MFASFLLPSLFEGVRARHLLVFYKQLADFGRDQIAFIGEPDYFRAPSDWQAAGRGEWEPSWQTAYEFTPPATLDGVTFQTLPADLFSKRLARQSSWSLYGSLSRRRLPELEAAFSAALDALAATARIEAIVTIKNVPSVSAVARQRGLPVIHCEFGPLRKPGYAMTGYWDRRGVGTQTDAPRRFRAFAREVRRGRIPICSREELLRLLRRAPMPPVPAATDAPFLVGLGLQGEDNTFAVGLGPLDLVSGARRHVGRDDLLIRHHSGGLTYCSDRLGVIDQSASATEFIGKCRQVMTVTSGMALEALLLGRRSIVIGDSPFQIASSRSMDEMPCDPEQELLALNFLTLGYIVPLDLMFNAEYAGWRLRGPSEVEIAAVHRRAYEMQLAIAVPATELTSNPPAMTASDVAVAAAITPVRRGAILIVYPFCLDHVGHGNIQRLLAIARYLIAQGFEIDLVYQGSATTPQVDSQYQGFRRVIVVEAGSRSADEQAWNRRITAFYAGHEAPAHHFRPSAALSALVRALIDAGAYRAVLGTYAWTAPMLAGLAKPVLTICDVQDIMHEHADACRRATGQSTTFSLPEATEAFLWRRWDVLLAITPEDRERIERDVLPRQTLASVRHAASTFAAAPSPGSDDVALYAASNNASNVQAAKWLLEQVWPAVRCTRPSAELRLAGLVCRALPAALLETPGVVVLGFQPDLREEIDRCGVVVAPYLYGSGLKIKVVEAACAGKATITTRGGWHGTAFDIGRSLEVHDDPQAFADALALLLGNRHRRAELGAAALAEAMNQFSPEACYGPIVEAIDRCQPMPVHTGGKAPGLSAPMVERICEVIKDIPQGRVVIWGNGSHTRSLIGALRSAGLIAGLIVDGLGRARTTSPEGLPVLPASDFVADPNDLIVLSSEVFESDMWQDLGAHRAAGGMVLGVYHPQHISQGLLSQLSGRLRVRFGAPAFERRRAGDGSAIVFWDSHATPERTWRLRPLYKLSTSVREQGVSAIVVTHSSLATDDAVLQHLSDATLATILELDTHVFEADQEHASPRGRDRLRQVTASTVVRALDQLALGYSDTLVVMSPGPTECLALAGALSEASRRGDCPAVVIELSQFVGNADIGALDGERLGELKTAIEALAAATDDRFTLVTLDAHTAPELRSRLNQPVGVMPDHEAGRFLTHRHTRPDRDRVADVIPVQPTASMETCYATAE